MKDAPQSKHARSFRGHPVVDGRSKSGAPDVGLEYLSIDIDISASEGIVTRHHIDACAVGGVTPAVAGIVAVEVGRVIALEVTIAAIGFSSNHTDVVDVEFLSGDAELLNVSGQDDLTSNEARVGVVGHEDINTAKAGTVHVIDAIHQQGAVDAQVLQSTVVDEVKGHLLHWARSRHVINGHDVVEPQHLSVTRLRLGSLNRCGAEVGGATDVLDVVQRQVDVVLAGHGHTRARSGHIPSSHQLMGELHVALVIGVVAAGDAHDLARGVGATRIIEVSHGHTHIVCAGVKGTTQHSSAGYLRNSVDRPLNDTGGSGEDSIECAVSVVEPYKVSQGNTGNVNGATATIWNHHIGDLKFNQGASF